jgi:Na+/phosphate symporter
LHVLTYYFLSFTILLLLCLITYSCAFFLLQLAILTKISLLFNKELIDQHIRALRQKDDQIEKLKIEIKEFESHKFNKQQLSDALTRQFQGTVNVSLNKY